MTGWDRQNAVVPSGQLEFDPSLRSYRLPATVLPSTPTVCEGSSGVASMVSLFKSQRRNRRRNRCAVRHAFLASQALKAGGIFGKHQDNAEVHAISMEMLWNKLDCLTATVGSLGAVLTNRIDVLTAATDCGFQHV